MTSNFGSHGTDVGCEARPEVEENSPRRAPSREEARETVLYLCESLEDVTLFHGIEDAVGEAPGKATAKS